MNAQIKLVRSCSPLGCQSPPSWVRHVNRLALLLLGSLVDEGELERLGLGRRPLPLPGVHVPAGGAAAAAAEAARTGEVAADLRALEAAEQGRDGHGSAQEKRAADDRHVQRREALGVVVVQVEEVHLEDRALVLVDVVGLLAAPEDAERVEGLGHAPDGGFVGIRSGVGGLPVVRMERVVAEEVVGRQVGRGVGHGGGQDGGGAEKRSERIVAVECLAFRRGDRLGMC